MKNCSLITVSLCGFYIGALGLWLAPAPVRAGETPPDLVRTAPIIPWAKSVGEFRYRSPRDFDGTITYYRKALVGWDVRWEKIVNIAGVRAKHLRNLKPKGRWEGLNIYEHKGATFVFVVFSDEELATIAAEKEKSDSKPKGKAKSGTRPKR